MTEAAERHAVAGEDPPGRAPRAGGGIERPEHRESVGAVVLSVAVNVQQQRGLLAQIDLEQPAAGKDVRDHEVGPRDLVHLPAVVVVVLECQAPPDAVAEWPADRALDDGLVVAPVLEAAVGLELFGRLPGDVVDQAAGRVTPEQRALRAAENLRPLDVEELSLLARARPQIDLVEVEADRGFVAGTEVVGLDAADVQLGEHGVADERHVRRLLEEIEGCAESQPFEIVTGERGD